MDDVMDKEIATIEAMYKLMSTVFGKDNYSKGRVLTYLSNRVFQDSQEVDRGQVVTKDISR